MVTRGRVQDGAIVLADGVRFPEGQLVTVLAPLAGSLPREVTSVAVSKARQQALRQMIGIWKTEQPPSDEQIERMLDQQRMEKCG